jgi:hypothetical protein
MKKLTDNLTTCKYFSGVGNLCARVEVMPCSDFPECEFKFIEVLKDSCDKYYTVLEEIKNKLKKYDANAGDTIIANPIQDCYDIYILVEKALEENS